MAEITLGDPKTEMGAWTASAVLRAKYQDKHYGEAVTDLKIKFDLAIFRLGYESPEWFANTESRCYQYETLCDFSTLVYSYVGYRFNPTDHLTMGLQPIPFGPGRFWDSSSYAGINNIMGLQNVS